MATIPRVYSVVNNPIASLLAYEVAQLPGQPRVPQVVLLLNDKKKLSRFLDNDSKITIQKGYEGTLHHTQFMASHLPPVYSTGEIATMPNAIFSGPHTKGLVLTIQKYIKSFNHNSNILLVNPPFGAIEILYKKIWQTPETRPSLFIGVTRQRESNIAVNTDEFRINFKQPKLAMSISPIPREFSLHSPDLASENVRLMQENNDLMKLLKHTGELKSSIAPLDISFYSYGELLLIRLERLIVESCIEPLAALYGCQYTGGLLKVSKNKQIIGKMIHEQVSILRCTYPFLSKIPNSTVALDSDRLYSVILKELEKSSKKTSRMRFSIDQLNGSNINELTGYFVHLAKYKKLDCKWNEIITDLVKGKVALTRLRALNYKYL